MHEFLLIDKFFKPIATNISDDCAFFDGYCVSKDILLSGVHFFADDAPYNLARKALRINLSDLASSGAKPYGFMLGLALPKSTNEKWLSEFSRGLKSDIKKYNIKLLGGDTCFHDGELVISITAIGKCKKPITRGGAKIGDNIFVSGKIGGGYIGLQSRSGKYELPNPRIDLIEQLQKAATSCIDISDGLLADLGHICEESKVSAEIISRQIPLFAAKTDLYKQITGGDDYELLFTSKLASVKGCYKIGKIIKGRGIKLNGKKVAEIGYEHQSNN